MTPRTHEELLELAREWASGRAWDAKSEDLAQGYLALSAKLEALQAERGEVVMACPKCKGIVNHEKIWQYKVGAWSCHVCSAAFTEPSYYQRVIGPKP